jgi:hypothetical protein
MHYALPGYTCSYENTMCWLHDATCGMWCGGKYYARVITSLTYEVKSMTNGDNIPGYNCTATHIDYVQEVAKLHIAQLTCPSGDTSKGSKHHLCYCPLQVKLVLATSKNTW